MTLEIRPLDPFDDQAFAAWHATYVLGDGSGREATATPWSLAEMRVQLQQPTSGQWVGAWAGLSDGQVVVTGMMGAPLLDNVDRANLSVHTHPDHQRQGHGSAMLEHLEREARERGRTTLDAEVFWPYEAGPGGTSPGASFALSRGYSLAIEDIQRVLDLPVDQELLAELAAEAAPRHAAYTLRSFVGPVPEELLEGWARLSASLMTEAPMGERVMEPETADTTLFREREEIARQQGRTKYNTVALDENGAVVAYTDIAVSEEDVAKAYQWGTLVDGAHRGHRLGLAIKVANLRQLQAARDDVGRVITYNAEVNAHMIDVNERLGFRPVERLGEFVKTRGQSLRSRT